MDFRGCIELLRERGGVEVCEEYADPDLQVTTLINKFHPKPLLFTHVPKMKIATNIFSNRKLYADYLSIPHDSFLENLNARFNSTGIEIDILDQIYGEIELEAPDFTRLPILTHYPGDGGPYITSAVWFVNDPQYGRNLSYHRMMILDEVHGAVRVVEQRGMHQALMKSEKDIEVAICIGAPPAILLAAACSPGKDVDELQLAGRLDKVTLKRCKTIDMLVPGDCEIVIEGVLTREYTQEGPFVDITGTWDEVRMQPVFVATRISHRQSPIYHALVPAKSEHRILMGMPKELDIYREVNKVCLCRDVCITEGGCSWLHAVVQISKSDDSDPRRALEAAFTAHRSLKHCVVVDEDIDIHQMQEVEWAVATRTQADKDLLILKEQPSSSLDPSATHVQGMKSVGSKLGIDATIKSRYKNKNMFKKIS
ncbi:UbiD family decarboxylase [candidate division KSB1 bacterium]|nr:UbiD family decarboxylase [candidate division KSB1 bacterium]